MILQYLKTLLHSFKHQKGFVLLNQITLITSMVVIMVMVVVFSMDLNTVSLKADEGVLFQVQQKDGSRYRNNYQKETFGMIEQVFNPQDISMISMAHGISVISSFKRIDLEYRLITENLLKYFNLEIIEGGNLQPKHFQDNQKVVVISEILAEMLFADSTAIGKYVTLRNNRYEIVGVFKALMNNNTYTADCYVPWGAMEHYIDMYATAFIHADDRTEKTAIETQLIKHAPDLDLAVGTLREIKRQELGEILILAFVFIGLSMLLPALLLTNLTVHRMETRLVELGIRRAFGANKSVIYYQLIIENIFFTLFAGLFSFFIGQYFVSDLYNEFTKGFLRFDMPFYTFIYIMIAFIIFGIVTGILPARKVSRNTIVQSLNSN